MAPDGVTVLGTVSKSDLTDEGAGLFTFTNNDGSDVQFDVRSVEVVFDAASNVYNFLDAAGAVIASIDMNASNVAFDNTTSGLTATDVQAALDELATQIGDLDLVDNLDGTFSLMAPDGVTVLGTVSKSDLTDEGAGLFTFTNNDGSDVQFDVRSVEVVFDAASNVYNFLDAAGAVIASIDMNASNVAFDNTTSGLTAIDVQAALDELATQIGDLDLIDNLDGTFSLMAPDGVTVLGTVSKSDLTDEGAGLFTFTNNDGSDVQFDVRSVEVVFDAASNVYNFLDAAGAVIASIDMNASNVAFDNTTSGLTATTVQAAIDEIAAVAGGLSDALVDNGDGTYTHTTVSGDVIIIDANTVSVTVAGGVYTFVDGVGNTITTIDTNAAAIAYDNTASGLAATNVQAALDELATQIGDLDLIDNLDGTFSLMAPDGITVLGTVSKSDLTDEGDGLYTFTNNDGSDVQFDVRSVEVVFDAATNVYNFLDSAGTVIASIDINASNVAYDNATSGLTATDVQAAIDEIAAVAGGLSDDLVDNGDGTYTHTTVAGDTVTIDANTVSVTVVDGVYTFLDGDNQIITTIDTNADAIAYDNTTSGLAATNVQAAIDELASLSDVLVDNGDGTYTHTTVSKAVVTIDANTVSVTVVDGVYTFLDGDNQIITTIDTNADAIAYDNTTSGLAATNVQAAIDEERSLAGGLSDILVDNGDGTYTHTTVSGAVVTIDANTVSVTVVDGVYTFLDGDNQIITTIDTNADAIAYDNTTSGLAATNVQAAIDELASLSDVLVDNGDGTYTHTTVSGAVVTIDANTVSVTVVDGVYTFLDGYNQIITTIDTNADAIAYDNTTSGLAATNVQAAIDELIGLAGGLSDILVDNGDGTYTHTTVSGAVVTIEANTVSVTVVDGVYTFLDGDNQIITTIDTNADAIAYDNTTSGVGATNVQAAIEELASLSDVLVDNGDGTYTHTTVSGAVVTIDANTVSVTVVDRVYTFLDGDNQIITTIDTNADAIAYDNTTSGLTATDVQAALDELATTIDTNKGDLVVSEGIEFYNSNGTDKVLADVEIRIANAGITTVKLADDAVTTAKIDGGSANQVLITNGSGDVEWVNRSDFEVLVSSGVTTVVSGTGTLSDPFIVEVATGSIDTIHLADDAVTTAKIDGGSANQVLITNGSGDVEWVNRSDFEVLVSNGVTTVVSGTGTLSDPFIVEVATGSIDTIHLADDAVTAAKIDANVAGTGLTQNTTTGALEVDMIAVETTLADGDISSANEAIQVSNGTNSVFHDVELTLNVNNGLQINDDNVQLGGDLVTPTTVTTDATNTLAVAGLQTVNPLTEPTYNTVVAHPTTGVLKQVKAAPRQFYMPAV